MGTITTRLVGLGRGRRPSRAAVGASAPIAFVLLVGAVAASSGLRARLGWVPVEHDNSVVDAALAVSLAVVFLVVAAVVVLPLSLAIHQAGHALGGRLMGMRVLAVRVGPLLVEPHAATGHLTRLPLRRRDDLLVAWSHLDDSPLPSWRRLRAWVVVLAAGPALNLAVALACSVWSLFAGPVAYVLLREMVWINLAVCLVTLLPISVARRGIESDGLRLWDLLRDDDACDALVERLRNEIVAGPTRPAAWPRERLDAWETAIRQAPASAHGSEEQVEFAVYLMLHALDRGDRDGASRWSQALQAMLGTDPASGGRQVGSVAEDLARVVLALHAARWDKEIDTARRHLDRIAPGAEITHGPWHGVAEAAVVLGESAAAGIDRVDRLQAAKRRAERAAAALEEPSRLHGVDALLRGHAVAVAGDAEVELQRLAYDPSPLEVAAA